MAVPGEGPLYVIANHLRIGRSSGLQGIDHGVGRRRVAQRYGNIA